MTDEQKELFEKYTDCVREHQTNIACLIFQNGFMLGARMMVEVMEEYICITHKNRCLCGSIGTFPLMRFRFVAGQSLSSVAFRRFRRTIRCQSLTGLTNLTTMMNSHRIHLPLLTFRRARIVPMAVCGLDASVHTMNNELGALVSANLSSCAYGLFLGGKMAAGALSAATLHIPTSIGIVNDMMRRTCHINYPLCAFGQQVAHPSASK